MTGVQTCALPISIITLLVRSNPSMKWLAANPTNPTEDKIAAAVRTDTLPRLLMTPMLSPKPIIKSSKVMPSSAKEWNTSLLCTRFSTLGPTIMPVMI